MSEELDRIFREEVQSYLKGLNEGLLSLELAQAADRQRVLKEMHRMAHSLKGAARTVGQEVIVTVGEHLEAILARLLERAAPLSPATADTLYDALDLVQHTLDKAPVEPWAAEAVLAALASLRQQQNAEGNPASREQASKEMQVISDDTIEAQTLDAARLAQEPPEYIPQALRNIFYAEAREHLAALNTHLLQVEVLSGQEQDYHLREMNREAHSLKGAARVVGLGMIETLSHYMETAFQAALDDMLRITPDVADVLYDALDLMQNTVNGQRNDERVVVSVVTQIARLVQQGTLEDEAPPTRAEAPDADSGSPVDTRTLRATRTLEAGSISPTILMRSSEETIRVSVGKLDQLMADSSELHIARMREESHQERLQRLRQRHSQWQRDWRKVRTAYIRLVRWMQTYGEAVPEDMGELFAFLESNEQFLAEATRELTHLEQHMAQDHLQLTLLTEQMQENISGLRMMPFDSIVGGFQRMVRDMAHELHKDVSLDIRGGGVEIDKSVLDALKDPLLHLLRNAVDHGVERAEERQRAGKAAHGWIRLEVTQRGNEIAICVQDDGRGLELEKIRKKAVERGLYNTQEAAALSDDEVRTLVFQSGLTTSQQVTSLSGRGLGMDIVRTRVESLRGRVSVQSAVGQGTTVTLHVPVSLTRLRVVLLRVGEERYAVPSAMVSRMEQRDPESIFTAEGQEMLLVNEQAVRLLPLAALLGLPTGRRFGMVQTMLLDTAERPVAFEVDDLYEEMELVIKPLGHELEDTPFIAGAGLLGSGEVVLVLDANELVRHASGTHYPPPVSDERGRTGAAGATGRILVVDDSITTRTLEKNILEVAGYEVQVAFDGVEAWDMLQTMPFDLVLTDVEMPNMNGFELTQRIKQTVGSADLPVILVTSLQKPEQQRRGWQVGADAYIIKSRFDQGELLNTIRRFL